MAPRHCDTPCFVSPHPNVLAKAKLQVLKSQHNNNTGGIEKAKKFLTAERKMPGLNDGTIFPKSHFGDSASIMAMSTAALDRAPLRSTIRYVCRL
jgi:immune inhibitor A